MRIKATYEDGTISFAQPLRFKHRKFEVVINIPEEELDAACGNTMTSMAALSLTVARDNHHMPIGKRLDEILGPLRGRLGSVTPQKVKEIWHEHLEEKYLGNK